MMNMTYSELKRKYMLHEITKEEIEQYKTDYYKYYYRNRTVQKRQEAKMERKVKCPICNKEFIPSLKGNKYCCAECRKESTRRKLRVKKGLEYSRVCKVCGKRFMAKCSTQKYCSTECYIKNRNINQTLRNRQKKSIIKV